MDCGAWISHFFLSPPLAICYTSRVSQTRTLPWVLSGLVLFLFAFAARGDMQSYETPYYIIHTDIDIDEAREAAIRMTRMAEEYFQRTREFSGAIHQQLPFYLYRKSADYYAAGGFPGSSGIFNGEKLMAIAGEKTTSRTWHVVQHEGFHQFARAVIGGDLPIWVNEGLAEYFGIGQFTGDGFVTGVIPPERLKRVQKQIRDNKFRSIPDMMRLTHKEWNGALSISNYDQAWSMVHFLAHGDGDKYQPAFSGFMRDLGRGTPWMKAWEQNLGTDIEGFTNRWRDYWLGLDAHPTADLYAKARVAVLTSFLARAASQKQQFATFDEFFAAAQAGVLTAHEEDWLPPSLLAGAIKGVTSLGQWSIENGPYKQQKLVCMFDETRRIVGSYQLSGQRVAKVSVDIITPKSMVGAPPPVALKKPSAPPATVSALKLPDEPDSPPLPTLTPRPAADPVRSALSLARSYLQNDSRAKAREVLERALSQNPKSPAAEEARKMLGSIK